MFKVLNSARTTGYNVILPHPVPQYSGLFVSYFDPRARQRGRKAKLSFIVRKLHTGKLI